jgi:hypothetical protein
VSIQEERELRERLGGLLDAVTPRQAPVIAAVQRGKGIRMRRRIAVATGLAVLVGGAVLTPVVLHAVDAAPPPATSRIPHYSETVDHLPRQARHGVIGSGTEDGHRWQVSLSGQGSNLAAESNGAITMGIGTGIAGGGEPGIDSESGGNSVVLMVGGVSAAVTDLRIILVGGKALDLTPVRYGGHSWVGLELPAHVYPLRGEAFAGSRELSYSVATPVGAGSPGLEDWWTPGQTGPARFTRLLGSGFIDGRAWSVTARIGPWGYCYQGLAGGICGSWLLPRQSSFPRATVLELTCGSLGGDGAGGPSDGLAAVGAGAREAEVRMSSGGTERFPVVNVAGTQMFAFAFPKGQHVTGITVFGASGQVMATAAGRSLTC